MRSLPALVLLLAASTLVVPAQAAADEMCLYASPTILDPDGGTVEGTTGDDVIVVGPDVTVLAGAGVDRVCVTGTDEADYVAVRDAEYLDVALGGGYDTLHLDAVGHGTGSIDPGADGAYLQLTPRRSVYLHLGEDAMYFDGNSNYVVTGIWDVTASTKRVRLLGDAGPNHLRALDQSCKVTIEGGRGKDWLAVGANTTEVPAVTCNTRRAPELIGDGGNDLLVGFKRNDRLFGGPGRDTAKGGFGKDTCRAEVKKSCER